MKRVFRFFKALVATLCIIAVVCFVVFCFGYMVFVFFFQKNLRTETLSLLPTKTSYITILDHTQIKAYGMQTIKISKYKEAKKAPWYLDFPKDGIVPIGDNSFVLVNQRADLSKVNIEMLDQSGTTIGFHTLQFQDSLLLGESNYIPSAIKVYSLSGNFLAWIKIYRHVP